MSAVQLLASLFLLVIFVACKGGGESAQEQPGDPPGAGMVWVGSDQEGLWVDVTEVTTAEFRAFVTETGYRTEADSFGWSGVFNLDTLAWLPVEGANWEYPQGPGAAPAADAEPVTQVSLRDARAYARWAGKRLPTEEEWMRVATQLGRLQDYPWGEEMIPSGEYLANWWQGPFPYRNEVRDGFSGVAAVKSFPPSSTGLYDISGNVWEWTETTRPGTGEYVIKGGSFLCATNYCTGFNLQQRQFTAADSGLNHLGFRCVAS